MELGSPRVSPLVAAGLVALLAGPVLAQPTPGRITGTVKDETGAPIAGAVVTADNPQTAPSHLTATSDAKGRFALLGLRRGLWTFVVSAAGFEPAELNVPVPSRGRLPALQIMLRATPAPGPRGALAAVDVEALQAELDIAESLVARGRIDEAIARYTELLEKVPALTEIDRTLGDLYDRQGEKARACDAYQRLVDARPGDADARGRLAALAYDVGLAAAGEGDAVTAIKYLERALAADATSPRADDARRELARLREIREL
jgi:tetratricopeptide (TPR) repeat protein